MNQQHLLMTDMRELLKILAMAYELPAMGKNAMLLEAVGRLVYISVRLKCGLGLFEVTVDCT
jgi:hypothetical protein